MENLGGHLHHIKFVKLSNGSRFVLKISPLANVELLRHERHCLNSEAITLSLLAKSRLPIPQVLKFEPRSADLGSPFLLMTHLPGIRYSTVRQYLTRSERSSIDRQLRSLASIIGQHASLSFGPVSLGKGYKSWRKAFFEMLESILMDGEDKLVSLPYAQIRKEAIRFGSSLDEVKDARLIVMGLGSPENVLIDRRTKEVTGLTDFGSAIWGDWAMTETAEGGGPKRLLYICYEAIVIIVSSYYRVLDDPKELDARKTLTAALMELSTMDSGERSV